MNPFFRAPAQPALSRMLLPNGSGAFGSRERFRLSFSRSLFAAPNLDGGITASRHGRTTKPVAKGDHRSAGDHLASGEGCRQSILRTLEFKDLTQWHSINRAAFDFSHATFYSLTTSCDDGSPRSSCARSTKNSIMRTRITLRQYRGQSWQP